MLTHAGHREVMGKIRVLIADDHGIIRAGLRSIINAEDDMEVVAETEDGNETVQRVQQMRPDVAIVDIEMPGMSGVRATQMIRESCPQTRVVILTMHDDSSMVRSAMAAGSSGFVAKNAISAELVTAIRRVHKGRVYLDVCLLGDMQDLFSPKRQSRDAAPATSALSRREFEVLELLSFGYTNQEIGKRLHLSEKTVGTYRSRIADKLGLRSRADIVRYALETNVLCKERLNPGGGRGGSE